MQLFERALGITGLFSGLLFLLSILAPNHQYPWTAYYHDSLAILGLLTLSLVALNGPKGASLSLSAPAIGLLVFSTLPLLQVISSKIFFAGDGLLACFYLILTALSCIIAQRLEGVLGIRFSTMLASVVLAAAVLSTILVLFQWLRFTHFGFWVVDLQHHGRPYANLAQPNNLATLLCCGVAAALYLRERGHFGSFTLILVTLLLFAGVAMTRSRMALFVVLAMATWSIWGKRRVTLQLSRTEIICGVTLLCALWATWPTISDWLYLYATPTADRLATIGGDVRLIVWQQLLDATLREPLFGYGWNQVSVAQVAVAAEHPRSVFVEHAHNIVIDLLVWNGILIGGIILLATGWWLATRAWHVESTEGWFGLMVILAILTHAMFELPLDYAYFLIPLGLCIGIVENRHAQNWSICISRWSFGIAIALGFALLAWIFVEYQAIEAAHRQMRYEAARIEPRPSRPVAPDVVLLTQQREFILFARTQARENMDDKEIEWMRKVAHRYPFPSALFRYALALGLNNRPEEAALELRRLRQIHPPERFEEARDGWMALITSHPQLMRVAGEFEAIEPREVEERR